MSTVRGTINRGGEPVSGLRVIVYEEIQTGIEHNHKPCVQGSPISKKVVETTSGPDGSFSINFTPTVPYPELCIFRSKVYVRVYEATLLVWISEKKSITSAVTFNHDLYPIPDDDIDEPGQVRGVISACGSPSDGLIVKAFEVVQVGFPMNGKPCVRGTPNRRNIGVDVTDSAGNFRIYYTPSRDYSELCFHSVHVYIEVWEGNNKVWKSAERSSASTLIFNSEIYPDCSDNNSIVRVLDELGNRVLNAEVYIKGLMKGKTNNLGNLVVSRLNVGDKIAARVMLHENETGRGNHILDSTKGWNYRVYKTSVPIRSDASGDNVSLPLFEVSDPAVTQVVTLSPNNALVTLNILVSMQWEATTNEILYYKDRMFELSELLYNGTDGQFLIEHLVIADDSVWWDEADVHIMATATDQSNNAHVNGFHGTDGYVTMNCIGATFSGTYLHEFGHYVMGLQDEYKGPGGPTYCTHGPDGSNPLFHEGGLKDSCFMKGAQDECNKKLCSTHPDNPHVSGTNQGDTDCWTSVRNRFNGVPNWRLHSPNTTGKLISRLPDSGIPMGIGTPPPSRVDPIGSYIPVSGWKPRWHIDDTYGVDNCPALLVRTLVNGRPMDDVKVWLNVRNGKYLYQGKTGARTYLPGLQSSSGEIYVRGAHRLDQITAYKAIEPNGWLLKTVIITEQGEGKVVTINMNRLSSYDPEILVDSIGQNVLRLTARGKAFPGTRAPSLAVKSGDNYRSRELSFDRRNKKNNDWITNLNVDNNENLEVEFTVFDDEGSPHKFQSSVSVRTLLNDNAFDTFAWDGQLQLLLPQGAIDTPAQIIFEEVLNPFAALKDLKVIAGPWRISAGSGAKLKKPGRVLVHGSEPNKKASKPDCALLYLNLKTNSWEVLPSEVFDSPFCLAAEIKKFGTYVVV